MNVYDYIKNYAKVHGIKNYSLKPKYLNKADMANQLPAAGGVCFFYHVYAAGEISDVHNITKTFLKVTTPTDFWDISRLITIKDYNTIQAAECNFIFTVDNTVNFELFEGTAASIFDTIYNMCVEYVYLTPLNDTAAPDGSTTDGGSTKAVKFELEY